MPMHYFKNYLVELNHILNKIDLKEYDSFIKELSGAFKRKSQISRANSYLPLFL